MALWSNYVFHTCLSLLCLDENICLPSVNTFSLSLICFFVAHLFSAVLFVVQFIVYLIVIVVIKFEHDILIWVIAHDPVSYESTLSTTVVQVIVLIITLF